MSQDRQRCGVRWPWCGLTNVAAVVALASWLIPGQLLAQGPDFASVATLSPTAPNTARALCYTDSRDLACDGAAGQVTTSGTLQIPSLSANAIGVVNISATGNIQANQFIGDGSGLSGVVASSADRITSGTTSFVVISNTGYISLTQGGTNTGWFDPTRGLVTLGVSTTGDVSTSRLYSAGNVQMDGNLAIDTDTLFVNAANNRIGMGTALPSGTLHLYSPEGLSFGNYQQVIGAGAGVRYGWRVDGSGHLILDSTWGGNWQAGSQFVFQRTSANNPRVLFGFVNPTIAGKANFNVSGTGIITSWTAIGANVAATTPLDVYGKVSATSVSLGAGESDGCTIANLNSLRINPATGKIQLCRL
jgi:hypothetical protein